eukprot:GEMP01083346.1.p1 GENE.GEMP01083346.1~~GEMP01083346.1.p1  ORF type:complete len:204 (+),score=45.66 GEMP01083346.1:68-679(+)
MWTPIDNEPFTNTNFDRFKTFVKTSALPVQVSPKKKDPINETVGRYCEELFHSYDHDKDGLLSRGEFADLLDLGLLLRDKIDDFQFFCQTAFDSHDIQQRDRISFEEFLTFYEALKRRMPTQIPKVSEPERGDRDMNELIISASSVDKIAQKEFELLRLDEKALRRIFNFFDKDDSGFLDTEEIKQIITQMGIPDYEGVLHAR